MEACDTWMNMHLREVICTAKDGEKFWRMKEVFIRGNTIKYIRVPEDTLGKALDYQSRRSGVLSCCEPFGAMYLDRMLCSEPMLTSNLSNDGRSK